MGGRSGPQWNTSQPPNSPRIGSSAMPPPPDRPASVSPLKAYESKREIEVTLDHRLVLEIPNWTWALIGFAAGVVFTLLVR